ncbi:MAG TPA: hypothetical protein VGC13_28805 [Longimicrobium sp.]|jgi:hypothetical protein|uniref:hypothetical protein n=1 Tax=Longimicrobium sp. TaxID=2029185 RepID=UPI002EDB94E3
MSDPRYRVARHVPAPPDEVLAAIQGSIADARRSDIPAQVRKGVRGLVGKVRGERFSIWLDRIWEGDQTELVGMVVAAEGGGSDVQASAVQDHNAGPTALVVFGIAGVLAWTGNGGVAWVAAGFGVLLVVTAAIRSTTGITSHDEAAFLLQWLQTALDPLAPPATASAPDAADPESSTAAS